MDTQNALLEGEFTRLEDIRQAIAHLQRQAEHGEETAASLAALQQELSRLKAVYSNKQLQFVAVAGGRVSLGGRPGLGKVQHPTAAGIDVVVTLLRDKEGNVAELGDAIRQHGMEWLWFSLSATALPTDADCPQATTDLFERLHEHLQSGRTLYIHCAAGIHRTGSFTNAFLQYGGYSPLESRQLVKAMREVTAREAVDKHWQWAAHILTFASHSRRLGSFRKGMAQSSAVSGKPASSSV